MHARNAPSAASSAVRTLNPAELGRASDRQLKTLATRRAADGGQQLADGESTGHEPDRPVTARARVAARRDDPGLRGQQDMILRFATDLALGSPPTRLNATAAP